VDILTQFPNFVSNPVFEANRAAVKKNTKNQKKRLTTHNNQGKI
jgi:hypothetical protein